MRHRTSVVLFLATFFLLATTVAWGQSFTTLTSLHFTFPVMGVVPDQAGNLYGVGAQSGAYAAGNIFEVTDSGGTWFMNDLFDFYPSDYDGLTGYPSSQGVLVRDSSGNLYGDALYGGRWGVTTGQGYGLVFQLNPNGVLTTLYEFTGGADGAYPVGGLVADAQGNLYGTALQGGNTGCTSFGSHISCGVVFELVKGIHTWTYQVIYSFQPNQTDGFDPQGALTIDAGGNLYGTTYGGGNWNQQNQCQYTGCGTVFKLTKPAPGGTQWTESILYAFTNTTDGANPFSGVALDGSGKLYGVTNFGEDYYGDVYQLTPSGNGYTENTILVCDGTNCRYPDSSGNKAFVDGSGNFWQASYTGGANGYGDVFELSAGTWNYTDIHDFTAEGDGLSPQTTLTADSAGNIYGTTSGDSYYGTPPGTVFKITPAPAHPSKP